MKLFQRLLVAPAALGLLAPLAANANGVNFNDISNYSSEESEINSKSFETTSPSNSLLAGGEGMVETHSHDGGFSETTTASFSADFAIGSVDGLGLSTGVTDGQEAITAGYSFQIDLNTSFTGEDSFDVSIDAGNADDGTLDELDLNDGGDTLKVDGIAYTFPVGDKTTVFVGDSMDGSTLYSTACVYGGVTDVLDDCGNGNSAMAGGAGTAFGASYDIGNGFTGAIGYTGDGTTEGLMTKEGSDTYGGQISYAADSYGASVTYAIANTSTTDTTYWGLNGYWTPSETGSIPSISVGYETSDPDSDTGADLTQWFVGLQWDEIGPGTLGAALGTVGGIAAGATEVYQYEAFYSYAVNDGMTITPLIYIKENATTGTPDQTGVMVKSSFSF